MFIFRADPDDPIGEGDPAPIYRVRIWTPPPSPRFAWLVDEWTITDAKQVTDAIEWASAKAGDSPFEVFLRWEESHTSAKGNLELRSRFSLLYGRPAEEEVTTETVLFESE